MARLRLLILFCLATAELLTVAAGEEGCDQGWTEFGSHCFKFFKEAKSWADAEKSCHTLGANLPSVHSEEENSFLVNLIFKGTWGYPHTWLGGNDAVQEGTWLWSDGSPWDFTRWGPGQPDNAGGQEHCLAINWGGPMRWNDLRKSDSLFYICAKDAPSPKSVSLILEGFLFQCTLQNK